MALRMTRRGSARSKRDTYSERGPYCMDAGECVILDSAIGR